MPAEKDDFCCGWDDCEVYRAGVPVLFNSYTRNPDLVTCSCGTTPGESGITDYQMRHMFLTFSMERGYMLSMYPQEKKNADRCFQCRRTEPLVALVARENERGDEALHTFLREYQCVSPLLMRWRGTNLPDIDHAR
jgi:hypothetical protein